MGDKPKGRNVTTETRLMRNLARATVVLVSLLAPGFISACSPGKAPTPSPSAPPETGLMPMVGNPFPPPPLSDPPTQAELGHYVYYVACMVCHGDQGQGLTEDWRIAMDPAEQNCWQSPCHAGGQPPEGYHIPEKAPAVIGETALSEYATAAEVFDTIRGDMPWSIPCDLDDETYWQLTAFLAGANQVDYREPLGPHHAADVLWVPHLAQSHSEGVGFERVMSIAVVALLLGAAISQRVVFPTQTRRNCE